MLNLEDIINTLSPLNVIGKRDIKISKIINFDIENTIHNHLMWVSLKNINKLNDVKRGVIICPTLPRDFKVIHSTCTYIICENPRYAFQKVLKLVANLEETKYIISSTALIDPSAKLGKNINIGHNVVIEKNCIIGDNTTIDHNSVIKSGCIIGKNVIIGANCVVGGSGFGYEKNELGEFELMHHLGNVELKDRVEIGNNTCIDRAVIGSTMIGENVKIDNLVHIAHGVQIGRNTLVIANAVIAGSSKIGENVWIAPSATIRNGISVENDSLIGMGSVILKDVNKGEIMVGNPAKPLGRKED